MQESKSGASLRQLKQELEHEKQLRAAAEAELQLVRGQVERRLDGMAQVLMRAIDDDGESAHFHNPDLDDGTFDGSARCWLYKDDCDRHEPGADFGQRIRTCSACDAFRHTATDPFSRVGELLNAILFLLRQKHQQFMDTQQQLIQSEKLAGLGELAAGLAHEINNPTGVILSRLDCMELDSQELPALVREDLEVIRRHAERLRRITKSLTSFARRHKVEKRVVILQDLLHELIDITERAMDRGNIFLHNDLPEDPMVAFADPVMIQQVFMNIILNARDAMPNGGELWIRGMIAKDNISMEFSDTGTGMDPLVRDRVFDPFFTTKEARGTGLGLSVSYGIIKDHGGTIDVQSELGMGATFRVVLPRHRLLTDDIEVE